MAGLPLVDILKDGRTKNLATNQRNAMPSQSLIWQKEYSTVWVVWLRLNSITLRCSHLSRQCNGPWQTAYFVEQRYSYGF